jgi:predicted RNA methylase
MQTIGLNRNTIDKFYTKKTVADDCLDLVRNNVVLLNNDVIIEPSAGNGSFIEGIKRLSNNYRFYDILPENDEIITQNFLDLDVSDLQTNYNNIHVVGNPPFGRQASLAIKFIKKCCLFAKTISFILPKSFKKESMKNHFSIKFHLLHEVDLMDNSFLVNNVENNVPCVFQIWQLENDDRNIIIRDIPNNFTFVKKNDNPDISFRRVGVNAGTISKDIVNKSEQSHYFIKFNNNLTVDENIDLIKNIAFDFNNTVGPKSISKPELTEKFNLLLQ